MIRTAQTIPAPAATSIARYDAACRAVADAKTLDEVKEFRSQAEALRAYAKQAGNKQLEADAAEIRIRATRRIGELMAAQRDAGMLSEGGRPKTGVQNTPVSITLAEAGIDKNLAKEARALAAIPTAEFDGIVSDWRERVEQENARVTTNLLKAGERAEQGRRENDFYPTPESLIAEVVSRWKPKSRIIWEPCEGDSRVVVALEGAGYEVVASDITKGDDFFALTEPTIKGAALCTNPPFDRVREFIDHAFAIGIREMCLVLPERIWASGIGREQFEHHRPAVWANMDWREDYLGKGGSPDRALAVAIWTGPCAPRCDFQVWTRGGAVDASQATNSNPQPTSSPGADKAGGVPSQPAPPATIRKPLRPHCLNPGLCAGSGRDHCHACKKALAGSEVAA